MTSLKIHCLQVGLLETNCYFLENEVEHVALCIDPGDNADKILKYCKKYNIVIHKILLTHGHYDHIGAVNALVDVLGVSVWIHPDDVETATNPELNLSSFITVPYHIETYLEYFDHEFMPFCQQQIQIIHTPGHTHGSVCFLFENHLISGDTIFRNSIGRTDFPGSNMELLLQSIHHKLMPLDDDVLVYPGHGMATSIGHERKRNPFIAGTSATI